MVWMPLDIPDYFYPNSLAIVFPYVRSFVSSVTLQANIESPILTSPMVPINSALFLEGYTLLIERLYTVFLRLNKILSPRNELNLWKYPSNNSLSQANDFWRYPGTAHSPQRLDLSFSPSGIFDPTTSTYRLRFAFTATQGEGVNVIVRIICEAVNVIAIF